MIARLHFLALSLIVSASAVAACGASQQQVERRVADGVGRAGNALGDDMQQAYELEGRQASLAAAASMPLGAKREDVAAAIEKAQARVRAKWAPIWAKFDKVAAADGATASAIEASASPSLATMNAAVCDLLHALKVDAPTVNVAPLDALAIGCVHEAAAADAGAPDAAAAKDGGVK